MSEQLIQSIVRILDLNGDTAGTGFVVSESGLIATCSHVIQHEAIMDPEIRTGKGSEIRYTNA